MPCNGRQLVIQNSELQMTTYTFMTNRSKRLNRIIWSQDIRLKKNGIKGPSILKIASFMA